MRIKTISAPNVKSALQRVRMVLGDDAIILSNRKLKDGVEVMASCETNPAVESIKLTPKLNKVTNTLKVILDICDYHRIPDVLRDRWLEVAKNETQQSNNVISTSLAKIIDINNLWLNQLSESDSLIFVGPPGSGKTVSLAKVALTAKLNHNNVQVTTMDTVKAGGYQQLQEYMEVLNLTALPIDSMDKLQNLPKTDSINLIDMPGINILDEQDLRFANTVIQRTSAIPILVLPANLDSVTAAELAYEYVKLGIRGIIFTQLDTARRYGSLITAPAGCNLPIIGLSYTPLIGEKLRLPYYPLISGILENSMI